MQTNLTKKLEHEIFSFVAEAGKNLNLKTYVVGGFVRDLILKRPSKDIDFVCVGSGIELAKETARLIDPKLKVSYFKNFGTAHFRWKDWDFEFVGARKESYQRDSRKPIVEEGTLNDDQNRRDFTINALAISLNTNNYGDLVDPFNGLEDMEAGLIQTPLAPDQTFSDDPLRMMRAIRFATQLDFQIDLQTFKSIRRNKERIKIISQERITDELNKIVLAKKPSIGFELLFEAGLLEIIFPEMQALHGVDEVNGHRHKDNFYHTLKVLDNTAEKSNKLWLRWAAILHDIAKPPTKRYEKGRGWTFHGHEVLGSKMVPKIFKKLRLPLDHKMKYVRKLVFLHLRPIALAKKIVTDSGIRRLLFEAGEDLDDLLILCRADITSKNEAKVQKYLKNFDFVEQRCKEVEEKDQLRNWQPPISGEIIMKTFDLKPCRAIGDIKDAIREAILEGHIPNEYDAAYELMIAEGKKHGLVKKG